MAFFFLQDYVAIAPSPKKKRLLTEHQKDVMRTKRYGGSIRASFYVGVGRVQLSCCLNSKAKFSFFSQNDPHSIHRVGSISRWNPILVFHARHVSQSESQFEIIFIIFVMYFSLPDRLEMI